MFTTRPNEACFQSLSSLLGWYFFFSNLYRFYKQTIMFFTLMKTVFSR